MKREEAMKLVTSGFDELSDALAAGKSESLVAYLDVLAGEPGDWPVDRPAWVDARTWPSVNTYRHAGEPIAAYRARVEPTLERVAGYGRPVFLTVQAYDRNAGAPGAAEAIQTLPLVDVWTRQYLVVGLHLFADRRPGGMADHPELRAWGHAFAAAAERPSRWDYWTPRDADHDVTLLERLKQETENIALTARDKARVIECIEFTRGAGR